MVLGWKYFRLGLPWAIVLSAIGFMIWRCGFGIEVGPDETFFILPAWTSITDARSVFKVEAMGGPRLFHLLNYYLVASWLPFSVYAIRVASVLFFSASLLFLALVAGRGRLGLLVSLAIVVALITDRFLCPSWSYHAWVRNLFLIHQGFYLLWRASPKAKRANWLLFLAGASCGLATFANLGIAPLLFTAPFLFVTGFEVRLAKRNERWRAATIYLGGAGLLLSPVFLLFLSETFRTGYATSMTYLREQVYYIRVSAFYIKQMLNDFSTTTNSTNEVRLFVLGALLYLATRKKLVTPRQKLIRDLIFLAMGVWVVNWRIRTWGPVDLWSIYENNRRSLTGIALVGTLVMLLTRHRVGAIQSMSLCLLAVISSSTQQSASVWTLPLTLVPLATLGDGLLRHRVWRIGYPAWSVLGILLVASIVAGMKYQLTGSYHDAPLAELTVPIPDGPLKGIHTSPLLFSQWKVAKESVKENDRVLHIGCAPFAFYSKTVHAAIGTNVCTYDLSPKTLKSLLHDLAEGGDIDVIALQKYRYWHRRNAFVPVHAKSPLAQVFACLTPELIAQDDLVAFYRPSKKLTLEQCLGERHIAQTLR